MSASSAISQKQKLGGDLLTSNERRRSGRIRERDRGNWENEFQASQHQRKAAEAER